MEEFKELVSRLRTIGWSEQKPWLQDFFPINSLKEGFDIERILDLPFLNDKKTGQGSQATVQLKRLESRFTTNLVYYRTNYLIVALLFCSYAVFGFWFYFLCVYKRQIALPNGHVLSRTERIYVLVGASLIVLWVTGAILPLLYTALFSLLVILTHAAARTKTLKSQFSKMSADVRMSMGSMLGTAAGGGDNASEEAWKLESADPKEESTVERRRRAEFEAQRKDIRANAQAMREKYGVSGNGMSRQRNAFPVKRS